MSITQAELDRAKKARKQCTSLKKVAMVFSSGAVVLLFIAFFTPPPYVIDSSVIAAVGEIFAFAALFFAWESVDKGIDAKIKHNNTEIELNNPDKSR